MELGQSGMGKEATMAANCMKYPSAEGPTPKVNTGSTIERWNNIHPFRKTREMETFCFISFEFGHLTV